MIRSLISLCVACLVSGCASPTLAPAAAQTIVWPTSPAGEPAPGTLRRWPTADSPMVFVPSGQFLHGARPGDELASENESPQHAVYVTGFWIDQIEVTNARYARCVAAGACRPPLATGSHSRDSYFDNPAYADYPVIFVSWYDASGYCVWVGKRLPTEAEWERAARGDDARRWPWGDDWDGRRANFCDSNCAHRWRDETVSDGHADTAPVGSYPAGASPFGALDMAGNVWEWVADGYAPYSADPAIDPQASDGHEINVLRGGSYDFVAAGLRATYRYEDGATHRQDSFGFRCAASAP